MIQTKSVGPFIPPPQMEKNDDLDREDAKNLEKWLDYNKHKNVQNIFSEIKIKQLAREKQIKEQSEKSLKSRYYRFPELRTLIIDNILEAENTGNHICPSQDNIEKDQLKPNFLKSMDTIKRETNKAIINELIYRKVSACKSKIEKKALNSKFSSNSLGNFKHLQSVFENYKQSQIVNYDKLVHRLQNDNQVFEKLFDYDKEIMEIKENIIKNIENEGDYLEEFFLIKKKIKDRKEMQIKLRINNSTLNNRIKSQQEDLERLIFRIQNNEDLIYKFQKSEFNLSKKKEELSFLKKKGVKKEELAINNYEIEEYLQYKKLNEEKEKTERLINTEIGKLKDNLRKNIVSLDNIEKEIAELREKKMHYQLELKEIYLNRLKDEISNNRNPDSFTWIIKAFWRIDQEFKNEYFPNFLDKESKDYLMKIASLENELMELKRNQTDKVCNLTNTNRNTIKNLLQRDCHSRLEEINKKMQIMKKEGFKIKKSTHNKNIQKKDSLQDQLENDLVDDYYNKCFAVNEELERVREKTIDFKKNQKKYENEIQTQMEKIEKTREIQKINIFKKFKNQNLDDEKTNKEFINLIKIIFGNKELNEILNEFQKFREEIIIKENESLKEKEKKRPRTTRSQSDYTKIKGPNLLVRNPENNLIKNYDTFFSNIKRPEGLNNVNYLYNFNYNYTPQLQNRDKASTFYNNFVIDRVKTAKNEKIIYF